MTAKSSQSQDREALLRNYLEAVGDAPQLSITDELAAAAEVIDGKAAENELAALSTEALTDIGRAADLRERIQCGDDARGDLIASTRPLVVALARRHKGHPDQTALLLDAGDEALSRAVDRYDPAGGLAFNSFARWWIERAMREVEAQPASPSSMTAAPDDLVEPTLLTALGHLHQEDCRVIEMRLGLDGHPAMTSDEVARSTGMTVEAAKERENKVLAKLRHPCTPGDLSHLRKL